MRANSVISHFDPDPERLAVISECMQNYDVGNPGAEWPNNIISRHAIAYESGVVARRGAPVCHAVDVDELALCRRLAAEAAQLMAATEVGMGSESGDKFRQFFIAGNVDEPVPSSIDEDLIRSKFGGTIFPLATMTIEPLIEAGAWWSEVEQDGSDSGADYFRPWRQLIDWFRDRPEFTSAVFVRIGDQSEFWAIPQDRYPQGTELTPCVLPRLALGLTRGGSLVGLFGFSVQT